MSYEKLKKKATQIMQLTNTKSQYAAFLLGLICQQTDDQSNIENLINICDRVEQLIETKSVSEGTQEQVLFTLYQNLNKNSQFDFQVEKIIKTPLLSENGSPELKPSNQSIHLQNSTQTKIEIEQFVKMENKVNSSYWQTSSAQKIQKTECSDIGTMELIQKLQEDDRLEQLKLKTKLAQQDEDMECNICCDTLIGGEVCPLEMCDHVYHKECLSGYIAQAMKERRIDIGCPDGTCKNSLNELDIGVICGKESQTEYNKYTLDSFVDAHGDQMSWCPTADCGYAFVIGEEEGDNDFACPLCTKRYCLNCRVLFHSEQTCKEYLVTNTRDVNDEKFEKFVKGKKYKSCGKCKIWVEKNKGCDHMTCRCGYQFCYKCGGKYMDCECTKALQLAATQLAAQRLHQKTQARAVKAKSLRGKKK